MEAPCLACPRPPARRLDGRRPRCPPRGGARRGPGPGRRRRGPRRGGPRLARGPGGASAAVGPPLRVPPLRRPPSGPRGLPHAPGSPPGWSGRAPGPAPRRPPAPGGGPGLRRGGTPPRRRPPPRGPGPGRGHAHPRRAAAAALFGVDRKPAPGRVPANPRRRGYPLPAGHLVAATPSSAPGGWTPPTRRRQPPVREHRAPPGRRAGALKARYRTFRTSERLRPLRGGGGG